MFTLIISIAATYAVCRLFGLDKTKTLGVIILLCSLLMYRENKDKCKEVLSDFFTSKKEQI